MMIFLSSSSSRHSVLKMTSKWWRESSTIWRTLRMNRWWKCLDLHSYSHNRAEPEEMHLFSSAIESIRLPVKELHLKLFSMQKILWNFTYFLTSVLLKVIMIRRSSSSDTWSKNYWMPHLVRLKKMTEITTVRRDSIWLVLFSVSCSRNVWESSKKLLRRICKWN